MAIEIDETFDSYRCAPLCIDELGHTSELAELLGCARVRRRFFRVGDAHGRDDSQGRRAWKIPADLLVRPTRPNEPPDPHSSNHRRAASRGWIDQDQRRRHHIAERG